MEKTMCDAVSSWPAIIWIVMAMFGVGHSVALHGKSHDNHNGIEASVALLISVTVLYWGGFFDVLFK